MGPYRTFWVGPIRDIVGGRGRPHSDPIGTFGGVLLGSFGVIGGQGETPIWDPIGFGVGPVRGIEGDGGDPNMGPYRIWGRPY